MKCKYKKILSVVVGSTSPTPRSTKSSTVDGIHFESTSSMTVKSSVSSTSPTTNKSSVDHGIGLGSTSPTTTKSSVDHGTGLGSTLTTTTKALTDEGQGFVQHRSMATFVGSSINLSCSTDDEHTPFWDYYPHSSSHVVTIYNGGQAREDLDSRFIVDMEGCRASKCRLMIENVQLKDAGRFVCIQPDTANRHLSLAVFGQYNTALADPDSPIGG